MIRPLSLLFASFVCIALPITASAFSDVEQDSPYAPAIYQLQSLGIVTGNPDGTFAPKRTLNRAELLTLVYRAAKKETRSIYDGCASDVPLGAWFSGVVCTAMHDGYVKGYPDGLFRPEQAVNRVEALKIILNVLNFTIPPLSQGNRLGLDFINVTHGSWYAPFLYRALTLNIVPKSMITNNDFNPSAPVLRDEAAEMIFRALNADDSMGLDESDEGGGTVLPSGIRLIPFPIHMTGSTSSAYAFDVTKNETIEVKTENLGGGGMTCVLYRLEESGFSYEYYSGYTQDSSCMIRASVPKGRYQIEGRGAPLFSLSVEPTTAGDGNDGFSSAVPISASQSKSGALEANDYADWYRFLFTEQNKRTVVLTSNSETKVSCGIYPGGNVDIFGEQGPVCGEEYTFPVGTYFISIGRTMPIGDVQPYSLELR